MNIRIKAMGFALAFALAAPAHAINGIPNGGNLGFTVLRDGEEVGTHTIRFDDGDGAIKVDIETSVNVKLPFIGVSVYHFEHKGHEVWRDGTLQTLESVTDDDGTPHELDVRRDGGKLRVKSGATDHDSAGTLIPASLWHPDLVKRQVLLNTLDGREMPVTVTEQGTEEIQVQGRPVSARHFVVTGGLNRELWYDSQGVLVKVAFAAKDDSRIEYVLK